MIVFPRVFCRWMECAALKGQFITSILGDRSERRGGGSTFPERRRRAGSPPRFKRKGRGSRRLTTHTSSATFSTTFPSPHPSQVCYFSKAFFFRTNGAFMPLPKRKLPVQLFRCTRQSAWLHVNCFSFGEVGRLPELNILIVAFGLFLWVNEDCF